MILVVWLFGCLVVWLFGCLVPEFLDYWGHQKDIGAVLLGAGAINGPAVWSFGGPVDRRLKRSCGLRSRLDKNSVKLISFRAKVF